MISKIYFFKLMNNSVLGKVMKNLRNPRDSKLVTTKATRNYLVSETNHHTTFFFGKFITNRNEKTRIILNKQVSFGLAILEIS